MPSVICLVLSFPFPVVLGEIRPIVSVHRGLTDIFCNLPSLILGSVLLHDPTLFSVVIDRMCSSQILLCTRDSVSVLFLSTFFRSYLLLLCLLRSLTWLGILPLEVLHVERVLVGLYLLPVFCLHLVHMFLFRLLVRLPMILRNTRQGILRI